VEKERLGHRSITTTEKYLHALPGAHDATLNALDASRGGRSDVDADADRPSVDDQSVELAELRQMVADLTRLVGTLHGKTA
jgi:hypothetical protein